MTAPAVSLLHHLQSLIRQANTDPDDDTALLQRFVARRDELAFAALLSRHGPMVFGVCRRILRDDHEAEDAFQAVFLLLARKAGALRHPETLAAWLYGTSRRLALMARRSNNRRRQRERDATSAPASAAANPLDELSARELLLAVEEELARLPERYRLPLILCALEGRSQAEAARLLGWTAGSLKNRLERGRARLRLRLVRRGLTLSAGLLALESMATSPLSASLRQATMQRALAFAAGSAEGITANVLALAEASVSSMAATKGKWTVFLLLMLGLAGATGVLAYPLRSENQAEEQLAATATTPQRKSETPKPVREKRPTTDMYGDPLPSGAIARLGTVRFRHASDLRDVVVSPDGRTLISAGGDSVETWDAQSGHRKRRFTFARPYVMGIDLSPDGKILAVSQGGQEKLRFWNLSSGAEAHPFGDAAPVAWRAAFAPKGDLLATLDSQRPTTVSIWDVRRGRKIRTIEGGDALANATRCLVFSPNGNLLAFPRANGIGVWDLAAGKELYRLDLGAKSRPGCVRFSSDGKLLAAARYPVPLDPDCAIHLWDMATGKEVGALKGHEDGIAALVVSPKGNVLASSGLDRTIRFWDLATQRQLSCHRCYTSTPALAFDGDGRTLVVGSIIGAIHRWRADNGREDRTSAEQASELDWIAFAPDGKTLISAGEGRIGLWEPLTGQPRRFLDANLPDGSPLYRKALSPDGRLLATIDWRNGQTLLFDVGSGKLVRRIGEGGQRNLIFSCIFSPDGSQLAGGSFVEDIVRMWDTVSGKELLQLKGQSKTQALAFAPDGATLATASSWVNSDLTVRLWKLATGEEMWRQAPRPWAAFDLKFSPDGRTLALGGGLPGRINTPGEVRLWEAATGKELRRFEGHRERAVRCVAFSPDGRMLASGSDDSTIRLWEIATGGERRCLRGHQKGIWTVSFSPDSRLLASASLDTTALIWDLTGRFRDGRFQTRQLAAEDLKRCWNDLADADAERAYRSIIALIGSPNETVAFLKEHLPPVMAADPKRVKPLLVALESDQFADRDKAMANLEQLGLGVEPALHAALKAKPSLEVRRRIEAILDKLAGGPRLRFLRALEVLEHIGTAEARQVLEALAQGTAEMWPTQEAKASLAGLAARSAMRR